MVGKVGGTTLPSCIHPSGWWWWVVHARYYLVALLHGVTYAASRGVHLVIWWLPLGGGSTPSLITWC